MKKEGEECTYIGKKPKGFCGGPVLLPFPGRQSRNQTWGLWWIV